MRPKIAHCAVPHLLKKANCAAECGENCQIMRRNCGEYSLKCGDCAAFSVNFGSNWLRLCINDVVGRPDQTSKH